MIRTWEQFKRLFEGFTIVLYEPETGLNRYLEVNDYVFDMKYFHIGCDEVSITSINHDKMEVTIVL